MWAQLKNKSAGFTIVELLIVIVIIGVLAGLVITTFVGIQARAHDTAVQTDLKNIAHKLEQYEALNGSLPPTESDASSIGFKMAKGSYDTTTPAAPGDVARNVFICVRSGGTDPSYGIAALSKSGKVLFHTRSEGFTVDNRTWVGQQSTMCPRLGIAMADPGYSRNFAFEGTAWKSWVSQ